MEAVASQPHADAVEQTVLDVVKDMTSDWDLPLLSPLGRSTRLIADLAFESIDVVQLVVSLEEAFHKRSIPFDKLLMVEGRYVEDLSIGEVVDFLRGHV
jgi:acyl carrier protein